MATINYNGMELEEFVTYTPITFEKPRKALCWDGDNYDMSYKSVCNVFAVVPYMNPPVLTESRDGRHDSSWYHCALLSDAPKPRRATNRELSRWLAQGNGEYRDTCISKTLCTANFTYAIDKGDKHLEPFIEVRKWEDTEWHEPDVEYLFGGDE